MMHYYEVTYPLTFELEFEEEPSFELIADTFQDMIDDWLHHGGTVFTPALQVRELQ